MTKQKQKTIISFKKAIGTINKIISMIENDHYCVGIIQQNLATIGLLKSAHQSLLENHLKTCFVNKMSQKNTKQKELAVDEVLKLVRLYNK